MNYFLILVLFLIGCKTPETVTPPRTEPPPLVTPLPEQEGVANTIVPLSWELPTNDGQVNQGAKPERRIWTLKLYEYIESNYDVLMSAKDIDTIIPNKSELTKHQHIMVLAELVSTVTEYESSWRPWLAVKDVNGRSAPEYMATGLCQMNAKDDQKNYRTGTTYTHEQLKDPIINLEVCVKILVTVVNVRGKITFYSYEKSPVLRYFFATLVNDTAYGKKTLKAARARIQNVLDLTSQKK